ncbi:dihydroneopterin aldolase [Labrys wisconsinensis]|uniref:7,8-dihydroneopterin aldolase n=1 Tax=Labrys wisconsinensis TaxID=425677 RepID=A0ABU0JHN2_9HYPH|nr:dihydroneopterin aldolase [Labrys wisconsinensis]MDQ0473796.1 dihydroneopterin aldolase [Labrys wisconsinensis]
MSELVAVSRVFLRALTVEAHIGYYAHEKGVKQPLVVEVELTLDQARFGDDDIRRTVDYTQVARYAHTLAESHVDLIETFVERLADLCLAMTHVVAVRVRVEKPRAVPGAMAGVEVVRVRRAGG